MNKSVTIGNIKIGSNSPLVLIAGPCVIESSEHAFFVAKTLDEIAKEVNIPFIFKSSYDKANRTSISSFRGPGLKWGMDILSYIKATLNIPILSDVHREEDIIEASKVLDIIQIPAFLSRQTDFIISVASTGKPVNIKKGQFMAPWDVKNIIEKIEVTENTSILLTERGSSFGYNNLIVDMRSLAIMRTYGYPIVFDATHSLQLPGGKGYASSGQREFIPHLARAAVAAGCDAVFMEVHPDPDNAPCDGPNMLKIDSLPALLSELIEIDKIVKRLE